MDKQNTTRAPMAENVSIAAIDVVPGRRVLDPDWIAALAEDFRARGQQVPIEVLAKGKRFRLIAGGHRLEAAFLNGDAQILAIVRQAESFASEAEIKLAEIAENFMRRELSVLDRAFDVAAWREVYVAARGTIKPGRKAKGGISVKLDTNWGDGAIAAASASFAAGFTEAARLALNLSQKGVFRALKIAQIGESIRARIALMPIADNQSELLALAAQPPARQAAIVAKLIEGAANVADAIAIIDNLPPPLVLARWERMSEGFARLKPDEQAAFFALHEDAILAWVAERTA